MSLGILAAEDDLEVRQVELVQADRVHEVVVAVLDVEQAHVDARVERLAEDL